LIGIQHLLALFLGGVSPLIKIASSAKIFAKASELCETKTDSPILCSHESLRFIQENFMCDLENEMISF
jgi:hypothetical protein